MTPNGTRRAGLRRPRHAIFLWTRLAAPRLRRPPARAPLARRKLPLIERRPGFPGLPPTHVAP